MWKLLFETQFKNLFVFLALLLAPNDFGSGAVQFFFDYWFFSNLQAGGRASGDTGM